MPVAMVLICAQLKRSWMLHYMVLRGKKPTYSEQEDALSLEKSNGYDVDFNLLAVPCSVLFILRRWVVLPLIEPWCLGLILLKIIQSPIAFRRRPSGVPAPRGSLTLALFIGWVSPFRTTDYQKINSKVLSPWLGNVPSKIIASDILAAGIRCVSGSSRHAATIGR